MKVQVAQKEDLESWLGLAAEVEHLFGPMVEESKFQRALARNIERGSAYCIREADGGPGSPLLAGLLLSAKPPVYKIAWMAVAERSRRRGLGTALVNHIISLIEPPAEVMVVTFGGDVKGGESARKFYASAGFIPAEMTEPGPEGGSRQVFRKTLS